MKKSAIFGLVICVMFIGCGQKKETPKETEAKPTPTEKTKETEAKPTPTEKKSDGAQPVSKKRAVTAYPKGNTLLITQSEFKKNDEGKYTIPDKASLIILKKSGDGFVSERIEDTESNVFHKALPFEDAILTLGGNQAILKKWQKKGGKWQSETLWNPTFGGKQNRLRDFEMGDFDKDGNPDLAIATHDQGVVAVLWNRNGKFKPEELDRQPNIFVHEIEVGDLDNDGNLEIYATPSEPNTASGKDQGGHVVQFVYKDGKFTKKEIIALTTRHVKEIMVKDIDGDGQQELYAAVEAETEGMTIKAPVEIRRFDLKGDKFEETLVTQIDDRFCRFLVAGDLDGDGKKELFATAFSSGVWVIKKTGDTYTKTCINASSGGFEHASYIADLNGDQKMELYVADDRSGAVHQYTYDQGIYEKETIFKREVPNQAMIWNITHATL